MLKINDGKHMYKTIRLSRCILLYPFQAQADGVCPFLDDRAFWRDVTQLGDVILGLDEHDG